MAKFFAFLFLLLILGAAGIIGYAWFANDGVIPGTDIHIRQVQPTPLEQELIDGSDRALGVLKAKDAALAELIDGAYAVAVLSVGRGGFILGGGGGSGAVYRNSRPIGTAKVSSFTVGLQLGGQSFTQVILMQDRATFERMRDGDKEATVQATAVAATAGAAASVTYTNGIAILIDEAKGLMAEAAVGGQSFTYWELGTRGAGREAESDTED